MLLILKMGTGSRRRRWRRRRKKNTMRRGLLQIGSKEGVLRSSREVLISIQLKSRIRRLLPIRREGHILRMRKIIALLLRNIDREPLVHTISLRKNINSQVQSQEALIFNTRASPILQQS